MEDHLLLGVLATAPAFVTLFAKTATPFAELPGPETDMVVPTVRPTLTTLLVDRATGVMLVALS